MIIGVWGDSIVYGQGEADRRGWVGRLKSSLRCGDDVQVHGFGVRGDTTKGVLKRFASEAQSIHPDTVIFAKRLHQLFQSSVVNTPLRLSGR
jgi:lysophospholipase L1-like esterase